MFGTLRYVAQGSSPSYVRRPGERSVGRGGDQHLACERCRAKKLKCSGEKSGCNRCKASSSTCSYLDSTNSDGATKRRKRVDTESSAPSSSTESPDSVAQPAFSSTSPPSPHHERITSMPKPTSTTQVTQPSSIDNVIDKSNNNSSSCSSEGANMSTVSQDGHEPSNSGFPTPGEQSNLIDMPDWPTHLGSEESLNVHHLLGGNFSSDDYDQHFDEDFSMSDFIMSSDFDLGISMDEGKMSDDAFFTANATSDTIQKPLPTPPQYIPKDSSQQLTASSASFNAPPTTNVQTPTQSLCRLSLAQIASASSGSPPRTSISSSHESFSISAKGSQFSDTCQCLQMIASILEELETRMRSVDPSSIDIMMNFHQEILGQCTSVLLCRSCSKRSETMMLLAMVSDKLANICEKASSKCVEEFQSLESDSPSTSSKYSLADSSEPNSRRDQLTKVGRSLAGEGSFSHEHLFAGSTELKIRETGLVLPKC